MARALVNRPSLLLLDEPLGALDLKLRRQMQIELKAIQMEVGLTFLHVTHDQEEAMDMADTVAVMNKGRIEQMGSPEKLYDRPKTVFVSKFLGQSNLFVGKVEEENAIFNQHQRLPETKSPFLRIVPKSTRAQSRLVFAQKRLSSTKKSQSLVPVTT